MMPYRYKYEAFNRSDSYIWHGEKEPGVKHVLKKVDLAYKGYKGRYKSR